MKKQLAILMGLMFFATVIYAQNTITKEERAKSHGISQIFTI